MKWLFLTLASINIVSSLYCASICSANTYVSCSGSGPSTCTQCDINYFSGGICTAAAPSGLAIIQQVPQPSTPVLSLWSTNSVNSNISCLKPYSYTGYSTYTYEFYAKLVGGDYLYRVVPINTPHYQIKLKFSIAFVGVWSKTTDFIIMYLDDTLQSYHANLTYECDSLNNGTQRICNMIMPNSFNAVDCFQYYEYTYSHNTTQMIINFTSHSNQRDSTHQFWNVYDILIAVVTCNTACRTCYGNADTNCFSCSDTYFYVDNNTCQNTCPGTAPYKLPAPTNSLTGNCVAQCPQGFYLAGDTCTSCPSYCIACIDANTCSVSANLQENSLWTQYITLWIILIILGIILLIAIFYKALCTSVMAQSQIVSKIPLEGRGTYEERATINETYEPYEPQNFHIQEIDFKDNVLIDQNPRKRKRLQRDMNRTRGTSLA